MKLLRYKVRKSAQKEGPIDIPDHGRPVTRREFVSRGLISGLAMVCFPLANGLLAPRANAQNTGCDTGTPSLQGKIPFLAFDLSGGASIAGSNVLVGGPGGQEDFLSAEGYEKLGLPSDMLPNLPGQINNELGLVFHADSALLRGILSKTSATTRANVDGTVFCARSENDTEKNPLNPMYGISRAGATGDLVTLIGTRSSDSGGRSIAPESMIDPSVRPTKVARPREAMGLVDTGKLVALLNNTDAAAVMRTIERLSAARIARLGENDALKALLNCAYRQAADTVARFGDPDALNPLTDPLLQSIFSADEMDSSTFSKTATVAKLVLNQFAGAGTIQLSGYDYHDGSRGTGEVKDFRAGQAIGGVLEYAARLNRPVMIYVFSDGSVASNGQIDDSPDGRGKGIWKSDNASTAAAFMLVYHPSGRPRLRRPEANQIGYFRPSGSNETGATPISNNVTQLTEAIVLNYLALHDEVGRFGELFPNHGLGDATSIDQLIAFEPVG